MKQIIVLLLILISVPSFGQYEKLFSDKNIAPYNLALKDKFIWKDSLVYRDSLTYAEITTDSIRFRYFDGSYTDWLKFDLNYFTNADETDPIYATDSANIVWFSDLTDSLNIVRDSLAIHLDTLQAHNTRINTNVDSLISHNTRINNNLDSINIHRPLIDANTLKITFPGFSTLLDDYSFTDNSTLWDNTADSIPILRADIDDINAKLDTIEVFYAASSQTDYTLANNVQEEYTISQNGVILPPSVYSISTNILTINIGVYKNDRIQINYKYVKL